METIIYHGDIGVPVLGVLGVRSHNLERSHSWILVIYLYE